MKGERIPRAGPIFRAFFPVFRWALYWPLQAYGRLRVTGKAHIPRTGPVLILANHLSDYDPIALQHACPRHVHFMAMAELFRIPVIAQLVRAFKAFPVRRGVSDRNALRTAITLLKEGQVVMMFPEGKVSPDGKLLPIAPGALLIAQAVPEATVICCGLAGTQRVIPYGTYVPRPGFRTLTVQFGSPIQLDTNDRDAALRTIEVELLALSQALA